MFTSKFKDRFLDALQSDYIQRNITDVEVLDVLQNTLSYSLSDAMETLKQWEASQSD